MFCWIISRSYHFHTSNMAPCVSVWDAECFASNVWLLFPQECWYLTHPHYQLDRFDWQRHLQWTRTWFVHLLRPKSEYYSFIRWTKWSNPCVYFGYQLLEYSTPMNSWIADGCKVWFLVESPKWAVVKTPGRKSCWCPSIKELQGRLLSEWDIFSYFYWWN